jgi:hypothetical protein
MRQAGRECASPQETPTRQIHHDDELRDHEGGTNLVSAAIVAVTAVTAWVLRQAPARCHRRWSILETAFSCAAASPKE